MTLKTGEAGGPYKLDIINGNNKVSFQDVLIGDGYGWRVVSRTWNSLCAE